MKNIPLHSTHFLIHFGKCQSTYAEFDIQSSLISISTQERVTDLETAEASPYLLHCCLAALTEDPPILTQKTHPMPFTNDYV